MERYAMNQHPLSQSQMPKALSLLPHFRIVLLLIFLSVGNLAFAQKHFPDGTLFSPIKMQPDSTHIYLFDYLPNLQETAFHITHRPKGVEVRVYEDFELILYGQPADKLSYIGIQVQSREYAIPLIKSDLEPYTFSFQADTVYQDLKIKGSFNSWDVAANPLQHIDSLNQYTFSTYLAPGKYEYVLVDGEKEFFDPTNPLTVSNGMGGTNSVLQIGNEDDKEAPFITSASFDDKNYAITIKANESDLDYLVLLDNARLGKDYLTQNGDSVTIALPLFTRAKSRMFLRVFATDGTKMSNDILLPISYRKPLLDAKVLTRKDLHGNVMYSVFLDRFYDGNPDNNRPLNREDVLPSTDWHGGDIEGVIRKVADGYFEGLGVNNLWISPVIKNPEGPYGHMQEYGVDTKFSGYHGYWPISSSEIDDRFGTDEDLELLIEVAHSNGANVLMDYVANHVHEEHPLLKEHPDWKTELNLPDGRKNIRLYDEMRLTTWFDEFMPTLDLAREDVAEVMTDSAVYWFQKFEIDGFRHDATKHIPNSFWRLLSYKLKQNITLKQPRSIYQIGETYGGYDLVSSYVNTGMLDAQFDFNLYDQIKAGLMAEDGSMLNVKSALESALKYFGSHHLMGNISGNHDKGRIISYADGSLRFDESAKEAGYTRKIENQSRLGYEKVAQLMAFNMVVPGIPVIYYGDEIGMPGGDDPDNRRDMIFENLNENQEWLKAMTSGLAKLRRDRMELIYGDTRVLFADEDAMVILRSYFGKHTMLLLNNSDKAKEISLTLPEGVDINQSKSLLELPKQVEGNLLKIAIPPHGFELILVD